MRTAYENSILLMKKVTPSMPYRGGLDDLDGKRAYDEKGISDRCVMIKGKGGHRFYADGTLPYVHKFLQR